MNHAPLCRAVAALTLCLTPMARADRPDISLSRDPPSLWSVDFQTGVLWQVGSNTDIDYVLLPQIISLRTPEHIRLELGGGELTVRARLNLMADIVAEGPESVYLAASFSPSVEYWFPSRKTCLFASAGGGAGWIDSGDEPGGQGQDFTLNWFAEAGVRHYLRPNLAVSLSAFFQHMSNGGATAPNPGIDAFGPMAGVTWHF